MSSRANGQSNNNASDNSNANDSQSSGRVSNEFHDNNITDNDDNQTMSTDNYLDGEDEDNTYGGNSIGGSSRRGRVPSNSSAPPDDIIVSSTGHVETCLLVDAIPPPPIFPDKPTTISKEIQVERKVPSNLQNGGDKNHKNCYKALYKERERARAAVSECEALVEEIEQYHSLVHDQTTITQKFMKKQQRQLTVEGQKNVQLTITNKSLKNEVSELKKKNAVLEKEKGTKKETKNEELEDKICELDKKLKDIKKDHKDQLKTAKDGYDANTKQLKDSYELRLDAEKRVFNQQEGALKDKTKEIDRLNSCIKALEAKLEKERKDIKKKEDEISKLKSNSGVGRGKSLDTLEERIAIDNNKTQNDLMKQAAKGLMNQMTSQQNHFMSNQSKKQKMEMMAPIAALLSGGGGGFGNGGMMGSGGGGSMNGSWNAGGMISTLRGAFQGGGPFGLPHNIPHQHNPQMQHVFNQSMGGQYGQQMQQPMM